MKILWVSSRLIGPAAMIASTDYSGTSGGWIQSEYDVLTHDNYQMFYLCGTRDRLTNAYEHKKAIDGEVFLVELPRISNGITPSSKLVQTIASIIERIQPDLIHLWGTETCVQDAVIRAAQGYPVVVFIQGLIGAHTRYYGGYMRAMNRDYESMASIRQKVIRWTRRLLFKRQAKIETEIIKKAKNIIVDSDFARAYCSTLNEKINFYERHLNASNIFRQTEWNADQIEPFSVFTVFGGSPDKGLHQLIKAIFLVKKKYKNVKVYIPGPFRITEEGNLLITKRSSAYEKWLDNYIRTHDLLSNVFFVGAQSPKGMSEYITKCHVYVNPSCMEVHALSLREAMTAGAPVISSLCGSVAEFIHYGVDGFIYRYEEFEMLALLIEKVFSNKDLAITLGKNARVNMEQLYLESQKNTLEDIYRQIVG